jgi:hypothetical protein
LPISRVSGVGGHPDLPAGGHEEHPQGHQGSALPIDFLLHDEVRHALRRGFWDTLERARR